MQVDRLFLEKDCPDCGCIRAILDMDAVTRDDFRGPDGQELRVFSSLSNEASVEMLGKFGHAGKHIPLFETHDGRVLTETEEIMSYLRDNRMAVEG